jgi:hypothetical protein
MADLTQKAKVRFEVGPGMPRDGGAFHTSPAVEMVLAEFFRAMTAESIYPGPESAFQANA